MFTGIITDIGHIEHIEHRGDLRVKISCSYAVDQIPIGASICCSGACLTVVSKVKLVLCRRVESDPRCHHLRKLEERYFD